MTHYAHNNGPGVYVLRHHDEVVYVGQSKAVRNRRRQHIGALRRGTHENTKLQEAFNADPKGWGFTVVYEASDDDDLLKLEQAFMAFALLLDCELLNIEM